MIDAQATAPDENAVVQPAAGRAQRQRPRRAWKALGAISILGAIGFNVWWYWRDAAPRPSLATIDAWMRGQRYAEAEPALRAHLRRLPWDGEARMMLARLLAARGDSRACARALHEVPAWWPTKAEARFREGQTFMKIDRARDAEAAWLAILKQDSLHPAPPQVFQDTSMELLKLYATEDRWEDAYPVMWDTYDRAEGENRYRLLVMRMRSELERVAPSETMPQLKRYVAADPQDGEALRALARAELASGNPAEAARLFKACLDGHPDDVRAWRDFLALLHEQGKLDEFAATLARVPAAADAEPQIWLYRGIVREKQGDIEGALGCYREALARNPFVVEYHYRIALAEDRLGRHDKAALHRVRSQQIRNARTQLPTVFGEFVDVANRAARPGAPDLPTAIKHVISSCETLGWTRAAEAWGEQLARATAEGRGG